MNFIEVKKGVSVRKSDIEAIMVSDKGCKVQTDTKEYESTYTYQQMCQLLNIQDEDLVVKRLNRIIEQQQRFVG